MYMYTIFFSLMVWREQKSMTEMRAKKMAEVVARNFATFLWLTIDYPHCVRVFLCVKKSLAGIMTFLSGRKEGNLLSCLCVRGAPKHGGRIAIGRGAGRAERRSY